MVKRIVANIKADDLSKAHLFYHEILGLEIVMDHGWIKTLGNEEESKVQISFAAQGGNGTEVPDLSIEVDNVEEMHEMMKNAGFKIIYDITDEDWGVRRFFVKDPFGKLINILSHK
ncbi:glyoxalase [Chryseobacterium indologenes]|uniref:VOC family protein n=1 Tax=Chryseobacterium indologenes TaxID=253 RepID=UPI000F50B896|nr:VOC family protein [Chryseobacterium indologenes]AYZ35313.1 glyoxalase [Chryseobacterium indologenes]MBF6644052.1 VOC family protein [Chryseobacterium indologenes]MBU3050190.1 VOC family protein [Chryseobacterium indologenes]MEB4761352.1 VOC family protein [Chryseobacterium indologenes]QQQ72225.1 VOC family protein [Chryseobacterium indologenes]